MEDNINESESEPECECPYYLRSKRRKLDSDHVETVNSTDTSTLPRKRKNPILHMPTEILQRIFMFISYHELSNTVRMVNCRFKVLAEDILNRGYNKLESTLKTLTSTTLSSIQSTEDDEEVRGLCKLLNALDMALFQHSVTMATIWRYVYNTHYKTHKCCMYGGKLIDVYHKFIQKFTHTPHVLYSLTLTRDGSMPGEVTTIMELTKTFCLHFEKEVEEARNCDMFQSGAKIVDILDCATHASKIVIYEKHTEDRFWGKYSYFFSNTWFTAITFQNDNQVEWNHFQRLMHMRIRRIVLAHTEMFMYQTQWEREALLRVDLLVPPKKPGSSVYTGYGDVNDTFYYYGVMNDESYIQKFHIEGADNDEDLADEENEDPLDQNENRENPDDSIIYRIPYLGLRLEVSMKCPLTHAPQRYLRLLDVSIDGGAEKMQCHKTESSSSIQGQTAESAKSDVSDLTDGASSCASSNSNNKDKFSLKMNFDCCGACYPRLPTNYTYNVKHERK